MRFPFWKKDREKELNEEIQGHLTLAAREEMEQGKAHKDAAFAARRELGNEGRVRELTREMWGWRWLENFAQDVRYGLRLLGKNPGFTAVAVLTLALGIGANTAIFSLVDAVMLKMLPVQKPEELLVIGIRSPKSTGDPDQGFTNPIWEQFRDQQDVFSGVFAWSQFRFDLAQGGESHIVNGLTVSGDYFNTLGVHPAAGRLIVESDDKRGCSGSVVLGYGFWQEHFGGTQSAVGSMLSLSGHPFQVIGVAAPGFFGVDVGQKFDVAVPICAEAILRGSNSALNERAAWWLSIVGRPKSGISSEQVSPRLEVISPQVFAPVVPQSWKLESQKNFLGGILVASPAGKGLSEVRRAYRQPLKMLMAVVGLVLLIACANIASLMLARAATRQKEISVRLAIGASRFRLIRQLLTECVLLSTAGAIVGVLFARWGCLILVRFISSPRNPIFLQFTVDGRILGFTAAIAVLTGILFGILPALRSTRVSLASAMKGGQQDETPGRAHFRPGRWIVACQVALSLVLLIVAGLFLRSFNNLLTLDTGFDRSNVMMIVANAHNTNLSPEQRETLWRQALQRLQSLPGVVSASESVITPISGVGWNSFFHRHTGASPVGRNAMANINSVSPEYFATIRSPIRVGRAFNITDGASAPLVGVINETMAHRFFGNTDPIGQYVYIDQMSGTAGPLIQIIGIVVDAKYRTLRETTPATMYFPIAQLTDPQVQRMTEQPSFEIRTATPPGTITRSAEAVFTSLNGSISMTFRTLEEQVNDSLRQDQLLATLSGFFGGLALLLAVIGLYGVLTYMVTQRRKEIGIRMALGAGKGSILGLIMRDVSVLLLAGLTAGVGISLWAARLMQKMLFQLNARDATTILLAAAMLTVVALLAGYLPARRAASLNPNAILRDE
ncbi:MAG: ABC transporter permease [Candidatus Acidiferrales bacterium]